MHPFFHSIFLHLCINIFHSIPAVTPVPHATHETLNSVFIWKNVFWCVKFDIAEYTYYECNQPLVYKARLSATSSLRERGPDKAKLNSEYRPNILSISYDYLLALCAILKLLCIISKHKYQPWVSVCRFLLYAYLFKNLCFTFSALHTWFPNLSRHILVNLHSSWIVKAVAKDSSVIALWFSPNFPLLPSFPRSPSYTSPVWCIQFHRSIGISENILFGFSVPKPLASSLLIIPSILPVAWTSVNTDHEVV